jgi:hypothetical protein
MKIKPVGSKQIPHPGRGGFLAADGDTVDDNDIYWNRRLKDGDVEIVKSKSEPKN